MNNLDINRRKVEGNFFTRICRPKLTKLQNLKDQIKDQLESIRPLEKTSLISMIIGFIFSQFTHEYSHLTAMRTLFTNIDPYLGFEFSTMRCFTAWNGDPIIRPELSITYETGRGIVSAAGPISDMTVVALLSIAALKMRHSNKKISFLFAANAFAIAFNTFSYAVYSQAYGFGDFAKVESFLGIPHSIQTVITGSVALGATMLMKHILFSEISMKVNGKKKN